MHFIRDLVSATHVLNEADLVFSESSFDGALAILDLHGCAVALLEAIAFMVFVAVARALLSGTILRRDPGPGTASIEDESHLLAVRPDIHRPKVL